MTLEGPSIDYIVVAIHQEGEEYRGVVRYDFGERFVAGASIQEVKERAQARWGNVCFEDHTES